MSEQDHSPSACADTHRATDGAVVSALQDLLVAVTYAAPAKRFAGVLAYEARVPVEFVDRADAALGLARERPQPVASVSPGTSNASAPNPSNTEQEGE